MPNIYTGRGDDGRTDLWGSEEQVSKSSARIAAYGTVDELIAFLGHAATDAADAVETDIEQLQQTLHVLMAELADVGEQGDKRITADHVSRLEDRIDHYDEQLPELDGFILPGGSDAGARLHISRSVARRVERRIVALAEDDPVNEHVRHYVNRLSDLLFVMARYQNQADGAEETRVDYDAQ